MQIYVGSADSLQIIDFRELYGSNKKIDYVLKPEDDANPPEGSTPEETQKLRELKYATRYGINGTFYYTRQNYADASDGTYFDEYKNYSVNDHYRICISKKYTTPIGRAFYVKDMTKFPDIVDNTTINLSNVQFAIGGVNLYLGQTLTKTQFNNLVASQYDGYNGTTHRTARKISPTDL